MNYTNVTNPKWSNPEHTTIDCEVTFDEIGIVPFTANPLDTGNLSSKQIFDQCVAGDYGVVAEYVPPPPYIPTAEDNKNTAINLLQQTDWTTIADVSDPARSNPYLVNAADFVTYRNALRAIVFNPTYDAVFPTKPTEQWSTV